MKKPTKKTKETTTDQFGMGGSVGSLLGMGLGALLAVPTGGLSLAAGLSLGSALGGAAGGVVDQGIADSKAKKAGSLDNINAAPLPAIANSNPYGKMAEGGMPPGSIIDVELGELRVGKDQRGQSVVKESYNNPNRYKPHATNGKENKGNFVVANQGDFIIPKKDALAYKNGDQVTRTSIEREVMKQQLERKQETTAIPTSVPTAKKGAFVVKAANGYGDPYNSFLGGVDALFRQQIPKYAYDPNNIYNPQIGGKGNFNSASDFNSMFGAVQSEDPQKYNGVLAPPPPSTVGQWPTYPDVSNFYNTLIGGKYYDPAKQAIIPSEKMSQLGTSVTGLEKDAAAGIGEGTGLGANLDWGRIAAIAPDVIQGIQGLWADKVQPITNKGVGSARAQLNGLETDLNYDPLYNSNERSYQAGLQTIRQGMNPAVNNSRINQLFANKLAANNDARGNEINQELQLRNAKRSALSNFDYQAGSEQAQYDGAAQEINAANKGASRQLLNSSLADMGSKFSQFSSEDKLAAVLKGALPSYFDTSGNMWKDPGKLNQSVLQQLFEIHPELLDGGNITPEEIKALQQQGIIPTTYKPKGT